MLPAFFYTTFACDPFFNMAMDEWMFARAMHTPALVFLRLYSWNVGTITIGNNQDYKRTLNPDKLQNTPVVKRITGGRSLYHEPTELTYAIAADTGNLSGHKLNGSLNHSGKSIAEGLVGFLSRIGIPAQYMRQSAPNFGTGSSLHTQHCLESNARHEIVSSGRKIVASAQRRIGSAFLQHGSIKIQIPGSHPALSSENPKLVTDRTIGALSEPEFVHYSKIFCDSMSEMLKVEFRTKKLSAQEMSELKEKSLFLKSHRLEKRELIKQNDPTGSLCVKALN